MKFTHAVMRPRLTALDQIRAEIRRLIREDGETFSIPDTAAARFSFMWWEVRTWGQA